MNGERVHTPRRRGPSLPVLVAGASFLVYALLLCVLSHLLRAGTLTRGHALTWLACGGVVAGGFYLLGLYRSRGTRIAPLWIALVGLAARLGVAAAPPMLESDYQRYLWDGAVTASGINPFRHAPGDVVAHSVPGPDGERLAHLASRAGPVLASINHPQLTTIYPPAAQGAFAAAYAIAPFSPMGLRIVFCLADAATMLLLLRLLRVLSLAPSQITWFAWNPILLREVYSSLHMDILLLPLIAAALLAAVRARGGVASAWLVVASAVKVWPIVLAPFVLRPLIGRWRRLALAVVTGGLLGAALWLPVLVTPHDDNSGFLAYGRGWQNNDGFFRAGIWVTERVLIALRYEPWRSHGVMRIVAAALLGGVVLWRFRTQARDGADLVGRCVWIVGAIFVLSPTQFPWYWIWCLPFLTIRPCFPLLLYAGLLPLYYIQDQLAYPLGHWLQHAPVWSLLALAGGRALLTNRRAVGGGLEVGRA